MNDANNAGTLAPCPFCGGKPTLINGGPGNCYVRCTKCKSSSDDVSRDRATELWNTRALSTPNAPVEQREAIARLVNATTVSCSGKTITIECDDHDVKDVLMDWLTDTACASAIRNGGKRP